MKVLPFTRTLFILILLVAGAACRSEEPAPTAEPTLLATATEVAAMSLPTPTLAPIVEATATDEPTDSPPASPTPPPSVTPRPATPTRDATATPEETPTDAATDTPTPAPTLPPATAGPTRPPATAAPPTLLPDPVLGENLLPNPSFEGGHYLQNNVAELQLPEGWRADYQEGPTGFGGQAWDVYVRPEIRVLSMSFLPPQEHGLYIFDGSQTVKIFKDAGAVSARLMTDVDLQPGTYVLEVPFFADVFESISNGQKFAPNDPNAGEAMLFAGNTGTGWIANAYNTRNVLTHTFTIDTAQRLTVGVGFRGRYAIQNNGWFVDNLSLRRWQ
ncbi:MAG: hypothetical protein KIS95_07445 [Anaerolineae bacterium]|uniref:hypothetical protein n=1 Tax=Promineifilum sp. TaxID=2664178 RepID=UPI001D63A6D4|nr:hypothetical protein [Anaerolineales bacterium]MCB8934546.1 hypothetical protein [Promineifilum sp.]MCO5179884.1 hypothetical protein [Promineifilum sp.]MCW5847044.1 hypothetical protein [Anaerolineae bacterium]